jgi:hypothetical protein
MIHLVTFTLNPKRDPQSLAAELLTSASWMHYVDDTWLVASNESIFAIWDRIAKHTLPTDRVLVVPIPAGTVVWGNMPHDAWTWIAAHQQNSPPTQTAPAGSLLAAAST